MFTRDSTCQNEVQKAPLETKVFVKKKCNDPWKELFTASVGSNNKGVLRHCPDLRKTPKLKVSCPEGVSNIDNRLSSEEGRINSCDKMLELNNLKEFVFASRVDEFHWDLTRVVETESCGMYISDDIHASDSEALEEDEIQPLETRVETRTVLVTTEAASKKGHSSTTQASVGEIEESVANYTDVEGQAEPRSKVDYPIGSFVIVQHESESTEPEKNLWVAQVLEVRKKLNMTYASQLLVHWYDHGSNDSSDILQCKFYPCHEPPKKARRGKKDSLRVRNKNGKRICDRIDTDTVVVSFPGLTKKNALPISVQNKLSN